MLFGTYLLVDNVFSVVIIFKNLEDRLVCRFFPMYCIHMTKPYVHTKKIYWNFCNFIIFTFHISFPIVKTVDLSGDIAPWSLPLTYWERKRGPRTLVKLLCKPPMAIPGKALLLHVDECINICYCVTCMFFGLYIYCIYQYVITIMLCMPSLAVFWYELISPVRIVVRIVSKYILLVVKVRQNNQ